MACFATKKLVVPTIQPVGLLGPLITSEDLARLYSNAFKPVANGPRRPMPKSKYIPSPFGIVNTTFFPGTMSERAYLNWITKLCRPRGVSMTSTGYLRALEILNLEFSPFVQGGLSTWEEVISDIEWDKSPGLPYVNQGCSTKRQAWTKFEKEIRERAEMLVLGEYVECVFLAMPKDELIKAEKEPRIFLPAPFHHQLACAILFKKSCDSLTSTCHQHSSAIGMNIFGRGLEQSFRRLSQKPYGYDGDHVGWDTSTHECEPERDFMKNGLPPANHAGVDMVFNLALCPQVLVQSVVLQVSINPSGWYCTTVLNTLKNYRQVCEGYLDLYETKFGTPASLMMMRTALLILCGGDDLAFSTDQIWFTIALYAQWAAKRGIYLESDVLEPRNPMLLTFFSHNLYPRHVELTNSTVLVACGRLSKCLSAFGYLKTNDGHVSYLRNAQRFVGIMYNLWAYGDVYRSLYIYFYHLIHHLFLLDGQHLSPEWEGVFRAMPTDAKMLRLRMGYRREEVSFFPLLKSSSSKVKRAFQSALKENPEAIAMQAAAATLGAAAATRVVETLATKLARKERKGGKKTNPGKKRVKFIGPLSKKTTQKRARKSVRSQRDPLGPPVIVDTSSGMRNINQFSQTKLTKKGINKFGGSALIEGTLLKGRMLLANVSIGNIAQDASFTDIFSVALNPQSFRNTKLAITAPLYTKFKFRKFDLEWVPALGTNFATPISVYCVRDPEMKLNGSQGTFAYAQAVSQLPDVHTFPIWQEQVTRFRFSNDGSSFFINPDVDGEDRFTTQGQVAIMLYSAYSSLSNLGLVTVNYECEMWEPTFGVNVFQTAINVPAWNIGTPTASTLVDNLRGNVTVFIPAGGDAAYAGLVASTVYQVIPSYTMGHLYAWKIGYILTPSTMTPGSATQLNVYKNRQDAAGSTGENIIDGSYAFVDSPPTEGTWFAIPVTQDAGGLTPSGEQRGVTRTPQLSQALGVVEAARNKIVDSVSSASLDVPVSTSGTDLVQKFADFVKISKN